MQRSRARRVVAAALAAVVTAGLAVGCIGGADGVTLLGYTTPREVYEEVIPAFTSTAPGREIGFQQSYGPSGDQSRAAENGLDADVLALALAPDIERLVEPGIVAPDWDEGPTNGFVSHSVVVFAVREGNPKDIRTWDDLLRDDVEVVTPNPLTSGGAQWNVAAIYGSQLERGRSEAEALQFLADVFDNVTVQPKGAREALQVFRSGKGDVLISYENEAITAIEKGETVDYLIPDETILIQNPIAVSEWSDDVVAARAFVDYALSPPAQEVFAQKGYRSVLPQVAARHADRYPVPPGLFTMDDDLGGWERFRAEFFGPDGYMNRIFGGQDVVPVAGS